MITFTEEEKKKGFCYLKKGIFGHLNIVADFYVKIEDTFRVKLLVENESTGTVVELTQRNDEAFLFENQAIIADVKFEEYEAVDLLSQIAYNINSAYTNDKYVNVITLDIESFEKIVHFVEIQK